MPSPLAMKVLPQIPLFRIVLIFSLAGNFLFDQLGDDLLRCGGHRGTVLHRELQEDFPLIVSWDPAQEVDDVLLLTHLGDSHCRVCISSISVSGR